MARITIKEIEQQLALDRWEIVSTKYKNLREELHFKCAEGHDVYAPWGKIRVQRVCPMCVEDASINTNKEVVAKPKKGFRTIGIDQSTKISAFSVYDESELVQYGAYVYEKGDATARINAHKVWFLNLIHTWQPDFIGIEDIQSQDAGGYKTFKTLAHLQGVFLDTLYEQKIPYILCQPTVWKSYCNVKGRSRADQKISMQSKVLEWYGYSVTNDEADAIGIGRYTYSQRPQPKPKKIKF